MPVCASYQDSNVRQNVTASSDHIIMKYLFYFTIIHLILTENLTNQYLLSDCTHLILPERCQCYHSGNESQLHCHNIQLEFLPKLPNNMRWYALDFSLNSITSIDSYVFSDIYVEKLDLHLNNLQTIDVTAFDQIQNLRQLLINQNQLTDLHANVFTSPGVSLEILDISNNPFEYLNLGEIFHQVPFLREFHAVACQINDSSLSTLSKLTDNQSHYYIKILDLSSNNLTVLCNHIFDGLTSLVELRLIQNRIYFIENDFIRTLNYLQILNLASNSIEYLPNLFSSSLEIWNISSNHIRYLNDYLTSNLHAIRIIDFDSNQYLDTISSRAFCFLNILTLEKLSFRSNNLFSMETFSDLLCQLLDHNITNRNLIDVNYNINLQCNCILIQFQNYLIDFWDLTCTQQGQDQYFISKITNSFSNCTLDFCLQQKKEHLCQWNQTKLI
ncbi:hypothetical protein I4U23_014594 [Adineta vaga]|nr:hypothetical protein I4U23_014594 [Adineta vaga]